MLNLTFNLFTLVVMICVIIFVWLVLPEGAKLKIQGMIYSLWARCRKEWKKLSDRHATVKSQYREK